MRSPRRCTSRSWRSRRSRCPPPTIRNGWRFPRETPRRARRAPRPATSARALRASACHFRRTVLARSQPRGDRQPVPGVHRRDGEREIAELLVAEVAAHGLVDRVRNVAFGHPRHRLRPGERRALTLRVVRAFPPGVQRIAPLRRLAKELEILPVHVQAVGAAVDLRDAEVDQVDQRALETAALEGGLRPGARLPATRDLAREYGVARGTAVAVFDELAAQGYLRSVVGSGTFVNDTLPVDLSPSARNAAAPPPAGASGATAARSPFARRANSFGALTPGPARAFRTDLPALDLFPTTLWAQVAGRRLRRATANDLRGCEALGYPPLRAAVADYLRTARGVRCDAAQIAIVSGAQEALDLVARLLLSPGGNVCMEDPGYIGATRVFEAWGARLTPVSVDGEGMCILSPRTRAALAYVTPAHQFPLGVAMSLPRRLALLEWARAERAWIFEDDYDSEFRFAGRPLPALQGLDA